MSSAKVRFPPKLEGLFLPARYKVMYGGRGGSKSWAAARALLVQGMDKNIGPLRILCVREVQKSIKESVHRLLSDQIEAMGLSGFYTVLETEIRGLNGTTFSFMGLSNVTADSIKSWEGADRCWVEEAHSVTDRSWQILTPTIRAPGSEIWITFNPSLDTDPVYKRFVLNPPPGTWLCEVNWRDNPWFPDVLEAERRHCEIADPENYANIWEGKCRSAVEGAIYASEVDQAIREGRITRVPYDPTLKAHVVWDLGWNDSMSLIICQRTRSELRVIGCIEDRHKTLDWYVAALRERRYNWGYDFIPHDGASRDFKTGRSTEELLRAMGRTPRLVPKVPVQEGIRAARILFPQAVFDREGAEVLVEHLKRYRRNVSTVTGEEGDPVHDEHSHMADAWRYAAVSVQMMTNEERKVPRVNPYVQAVPGVM